MFHVSSGKFLFQFILVLLVKVVTGQAKEIDDTREFDVRHYFFLSVFLYNFFNTSQNENNADNSEASLKEGDENNKNQNGTLVKENLQNGIAHEHPSKVGAKLM